MSKPLFEERADRTLDKVRAVYAQRGGEYADTWRTCRFIAMKATAKKLGLVIHDDFFRALATAAFYDMKYERLSGGYKDDSVIDAIAYGSFWIDEMVDLESKEIHQSFSVTVEPFKERPPLKPFSTKPQENAVR